MDFFFSQEKEEVVSSVSCNTESCDIVKKNQALKSQIYFAKIEVTNLPCCQKYKIINLSSSCEKTDVIKIRLEQEFGQ